MKIFITGGTGFIGSKLINHLKASNHDITIITRSKRSEAQTENNIHYLEADASKPGDWQALIPEMDIIINLAGSTIFQIWDEKAKHKIRNSRINITRNLVNAIKESNKNNITLVNASAIGYYGPRDDDEKLTESAATGDDFLASVCKDWEAEALRAEETGNRVVRCRFGIILGKDGGALKTMLTPFKLGLGSPLGSGKQWFSWIHHEDICRIILFIIENPQLSGAINCTAPNPVQNSELTYTLGQVINKPVFLPGVPEIVLKTILGELGNVILKGQRVIPEKLLNNGFTFNHPELEAALKDILK
jgi:uncharacterized protein (TIGR01777 family)